MGGSISAEHGIGIDRSTS
ncbi:hypothetical protein [Bradyrhizobium sp.]|nr:hypothetical protein [Bradyrhizobium sp.]HWX57468.1 hypothetical protein [Bradyrhizobium sp.]